MAGSLIAAAILTPAILVGLLAPAIVGCDSLLSHCSPGYDDRTTEVRVCDGNVVASHSESCGSEWNQNRTDCTAQAKVCAAGYCVTSCTTDEVCAPEEWCSSITSADGKRTCQKRLSSGGDCTASATACATGLICAPRPIWTPPPPVNPQDAGADAGADANADAGGAAVHAYTTTSYCQDDCTKIDPKTQTCPFGATSVCSDNHTMTCRCGVPDVVAKTCDPGSMCLFTDKTGEAFCSVSADPDPKCAQVGSYCTGHTFVTCQQGYATSRTDCPVEMACTPFGCSAGR